MISLEQVQLLESRVSKAIEHVEKLTSENAALASERAGLQKKLEANQKRIDELEVHIMRFKEDQGRIEDGILAALDRLSQFEEAFEKSLKDKVTKKPRASGSPAKERDKAPDNSSEDNSKGIYFDISEKEAEKESDDASGEDPDLERELDIF